MENLQSISINATINNANYYKYRLMIEPLLAIFLLILLSPIFIIVALYLAIFFKSKIIFKQKRKAQGEGYLYIYKFKTMIDSGVINITHPKERIIRGGNFLRKYHFDELPQLINIIKGEMSFIGPRNEPYFYYDEIIKVFPNYQYRYIIKPGLFGMGQIMVGHTDTIELAIEKYKYDMDYISKISIMNDLYIIFATLKVILFENKSK